MTGSFKSRLGLGLAIALAAAAVSAGPLEPDCTPEKAAKHTAEKATVGVSNRCDPKKTASQGAKKATGTDDKNSKDRAKDKTPNKDKDKS